MALHSVEADGGRAEMFLKRKWESLVAGEGGCNICDISKVNPWRMPLVYSAQQQVAS